MRISRKDAKSENILLIHTQSNQKCNLDTYLFNGLPDEIFSYILWFLSFTDILHLRSTYRLASMIATNYINTNRLHFIRTSKFSQWLFQTVWCFDNLILEWGTPIDKRDQYYYPHNINVLKPTLFQINESIKQMHCGNAHCICLTQANSVYVWGGNEYGQLGLGDTINRLKPTPLALALGANERVILVRGGWNVTFFVTNMNRIYSMGHWALGLLGLEDVNECCLKPRLMTLELEASENIQQLICSPYFVFCITNLRLFCWGLSEHGRLGIGECKHKQATPTIVDIPLTKGEYIKQLDFSYLTVICFTNYDKLYTWGFNRDGLLGLGYDSYSELTPQRLLLRKNDNEKFIQLCCGGRNCFTILLTNYGVYGWGGNRSGQLGLGEKSERVVPHKIKLPCQTNEKVIQIACGDKHVIYLTDQYNIIVCGSNEHGQLGIGKNLNYITRPERVLLCFLQQGEKIHKIACGAAYSLCFTNLGHIYGWGRNLRGHLAFESKKNINQPTLLPIINDYIARFRHRLFTYPSLKTKTFVPQTTENNLKWKQESSNRFF